MKDMILSTASTREILEELSHRSRDGMHTNHIAFTLSDICEELLRDLPEHMLQYRRVKLDG